jgi:two-component system response regulator HydG
MAVRLMERGGVDLMVAGVDPSDTESLELLAYMRRKHRPVPVIILFPGSHPERIKEALRMGALTVLKYPVPATELRAAVTQALGPATAAPPPPNAVPAFAGNGLANGHHVALVNPRLERMARDWGLIGGDTSLRQTIELAATVAPMRTPVLIDGEHGTGKSVMARALHQMSGRGDQPFVAIDCTALAGGWHDSHGGSGSNTAQSIDWAGKLGQAQGGTLFLDEVSALPDEIEVQLLRFLQDRELDSMAAHHAAHNDVRVVMSTSENLLNLVDQGKFRQDLYHRISVICLRLPPLRHRGSDIEQLAEAFRARFTHEFNKNIIGFTRDALDILIKHDWPGNVRELETVIHRGVALCQGNRITSGQISPSLGHPRATRTPMTTQRPHAPMNIRPLKEALEEPEKRIIIQALQALNWNRQETARVLDINRTTLYKKMKKYGLLVDGPIWVN